MRPVQVLQLGIKYHTVISARGLPQNILCECFNGYMTMFSLKMLEFDDIDLFIRK